MMESKQPLSIYLHIPFCMQKCLYCDFVSAPATKEERAMYVQQLMEEIERESNKYQNRVVKTVFFGGGTPSLLSCEQMGAILEVLRRCFDMESCEEITVEVNPATADLEKLQGYYDQAINRLSIGLQSTNGKELQLLGRLHTYEEFLQTYRNARAVGFTNINIDLMAGIPSQTIESYEETLRLVCDLEPEHISAYSLIIEEGTPFYDIYEEGNREVAGVHPISKQVEVLVSEDEERAMYERTKTYLETRGYHRYEISNYAKDGYECAHNNVYWERGDYVGFGLNAASMVANIRFRGNEEVEVLSKEEQMEEYMYLGLRRIEGVSYKRFADLYEVGLCEIYGEVISRLQQEELLEIEGDYVRLTKLGLDLSNYVLAQFLL